MDNVLDIEVALTHTHFLLNLACSAAALTTSALSDGHGPGILVIMLSPL